MLTKLVEGFDKCTEYPLKVAEKHFERLEPGLRWRDWSQLLTITLLATGSGWAIIHVEEVLERALLPSTWTEWLLSHHLHHSLSALFGLIFLPILYMAKLGNEYRKDRNQLRTELGEARGLYEKLREPTFALDLVGELLLASKNHEPIKFILEGLTPGNLEIVRKLDELGQLTVKRVELLNFFTRMPIHVQATLSRFLAEDLLKHPWGPLYMTFAIQLQLDPWTQAARRSPRYVFVRDIEELECFYDNDEDAKTAFRDRLEKDFDTVLGLVDGTLWSVMYKDIRVWDQDSYYRSNASLLSRAKDLRTDLRRLFIYEELWLSNEDVLKPLAKAALWHAKCGYPCRYVKIKRNEKDMVESVNDMGYVVEGVRVLIDASEKKCIASCVVNETNIMMYQVPPPLEPRSLRTRDPKRYIYRCNAEPVLVNDYKNHFRQVWDSSADSGEVQSFLKDVEKMNPNLFKTAVQEFDKACTG